MPPVKFTEVITFTSEDPNHPANNLLRPDTFRKWKCASGSSEKQASVTLKLERLSSINSIDIGNEGAAFVEVLVARESGDFQVLLVASSFMTPVESRNASNLNRVRMFSSDKLNKTVSEQKWDRLKVICTQPFNKNLQYGLSFITANASSEGSSDSKIVKLGSFTLKEEESDPISIGSVFARRKEAETSSPLTGAAAIRAASTTAAGTTTSSSPSFDTNKKESNPPEVGFYQLKKNSSSADTSKTSSPKPNSSDKHKEKNKDSQRNREADRESEKKKDKDAKRKAQLREEEERAREKEKRRKAERKNEEERNKQKDKGKETEGKKRKHSDDATKPLPKSSSSGASSSSSKRKSAPFSSLMKDVNFVLSGYQNPQRSQIRDMIIEMGGRYKSDWDPSSTHLICAFTNTPKYQQVKGKGRIVTAKWVFDSHKNKIRYPCKRYALVKSQNGEDSEEEIWAEELLPKESKPKPLSRQATSDSEESFKGKNSDNDYSDDEDTEDEIEKVLAIQKTKEKKAPSPTNDSEDKGKTTKDTTKEPANKRIKVEKDGGKSSDSPSRRKQQDSTAIKTELNGNDDSVYDDDTDIDEDNKEHVMRPDTSSLPLPVLGDYLKGKTFFIYGKMSTDIRNLLTRYIIAFDGVVEDYMKDNVNFIITEDEWDDNFDDALSDNASIQFVKPSWIWRCSDKQKLVPFQPFMVVPRE